MGIWMWNGGWIQGMDMGYWIVDGIWDNMRIGIVMVSKDT